MQGHVAYSSSRSSSIFHSWPGDPPLWGQLPRSYYSSAEWQTCWWGMEPLQTMVQGQISGMPHKLIFYSLTLWTRQLAKLRWTGFALQRCHGQVHDFLGGWLSQGQAERDWHSAEQDKSLLRLVPFSCYKKFMALGWPLTQRMKCVCKAGPFFCFTKSWLFKAGSNALTERCTKWCQSSTLYFTFASLWRPRVETQGTTTCIKKRISWNMSERYVANVILLPWT